MNHFFALELAPDAREAVAALAQDWRQRLTRRASWYDPADYHVTLKFLGDVPEARQAELIAAAQPIAMEAGPLDIALQGVGVFPNTRSPSVLWAGVAVTPALTELAANLDAALAGQGFRRENRPYTPHVTLARVRTPGALTPTDWPEDADRPLPAYAAARFALMQTLPAAAHQNGRPVRYNIVQLFPLGDAHS